MIPPPPSSTRPPSGRTPRGRPADAKPLQTDRLAQGLVPPTNRWFSSLALGRGVARLRRAAELHRAEDRLRLRGPEGRHVGQGHHRRRRLGRHRDRPGVQSTVVSGIRRPHRHPRAAGERRGSARPHRARPGLAGGDLHGPTRSTSGRTSLRGRRAADGDRRRPHSASSSTRPRPAAQPLGEAGGGTVTWFAVPDGGSAATMASAVAPVTAGRAGVCGREFGSATTTLTYAHEGRGRRRGHRHAPPEGRSRGRDDL